MRRPQGWQDIIEEYSDRACRKERQKRGNRYFAQTREPANVDHAMGIANAI